MPVLSAKLVRIFLHREFCFQAQVRGVELTREESQEYFDSRNTLPKDGLRPYARPIFKGTPTRNRTPSIHTDRLRDANVLMM